MSVLQYPDGFDAADLQIWNNAAFDHGESEPLTWASSSNKPDCVNLTLSLESDDCSKENRTPVGNRQVRLLNLNLNLPVEPEPGSPVLKGRCSKEGMAEDGRRGSRDIDAEIEEIEREISRLSSRLEALRLEKEEKKVSVLKPKISRRGVSLGPVEIAASAVKSRMSNYKMDITPVPSVQSRRKSCFWKLQEIDELKVTKERRKSLSLTVSPKTRKTASKTQPLKQAATTVGWKRGVKKEEGVISSIQPKTLFKEGEKSAKKPAKPGRVIPSRYNQITASAAARKRSFPENNKEEADRFDKRRASQGSSTTSESSAKGKKRWEIPREVVLYKSTEEDPAEEDKKKGNSSVVRITEVLPKIRTVRNFVNESPRDSGPAKRAAELVGRRNYFGSGEEETGQSPFCQALSFLEDVEEE